MAVDTIMVSRWGWEQTNVDYYRVLAITDGGRAKLQKIGSAIVQNNVKEMTGKVVPDDTKEVGKPILRKICRPSYGGEFVAIEAKTAYARVWDGEPDFFSGYA